MGTQALLTIKRAEEGTEVELKKGLWNRGTISRLAALKVYREPQRS